MSYQIIQDLCSCCHRCRIECPRNAIRFRNAKYWIDQTHCVKCGKCTSVCHNGCIIDSSASRKLVSHDPLTYDCDICVIGAGGAGMVAAAKAVSMGRKVIVVEKNHEIGGSAWYATGFITHYSKWHEVAGMPDPRENLYHEFEHKLGNRVNMKLVHRLFEANRDFVDWMIDTQNLAKDYVLGTGAVFGPSSLVQRTKCPWNNKRIDEMIGPGGSGWLITSKLEQYLLEQKTPILLNTAAKKLKMDTAGAVCGVMCEDEGGIISINCRSVIITSGAFSRNKEIMQKMQPMFYEAEKEPVHIFTCSTCTGDGIRLCEEIDADIDYQNRRVNMFGPKRHPYPAVTLEIGNGPMFNYEGKRYQSRPGMQEVSDLAYDKKRYLWMIIDHSIAEENMERISHPEGTMTGLDLSHFVKNWEEILQQESADNSVIIADTLEELAEKLHYDKNSFLLEIEAYNRSLKNTQASASSSGEPETDIEKFMAMMAGAKAKPIQNGPFYAIKQTLFHENSVGGININENTCVTKKGIPIPGLFAAGDTTRGIMVSGDIGVNYIEMIFSALTVAFNSGYIAGTEAANYCDC